MGGKIGVFGCLKAFFGEEGSWGGIVGEEGNTEPPKAAEEKKQWTTVVTKRVTICPFIILIKAFIR